MSPTECFKDHDIPFKREEKKKNKTKQKPTEKWGGRKVDVVESSTFPGAPTSSWPTVEHLGWGPQPPMPFGVPFPQK